MDDDARMHGLVPPPLDDAAVEHLALTSAGLLGGAEPLVAQALDAAAALVPAELSTLLAGVAIKLPAVFSLALEGCAGALIELPLELELLDPRP